MYNVPISFSYSLASNVIMQGAKLDVLDHQERVSWGDTI